MPEDGESKEGRPFLQGYKSVLDSKTNEDALVGQNPYLFSISSYKNNKPVCFLGNHHQIPSRFDETLYQQFSCLVFNLTFLKTFRLILQDGNQGMVDFNSDIHGNST